MITLKDTNHRLVNHVLKSDTEVRRSYNKDEFVTTIINSLPINTFNNNRDLLLYFYNNVSEINSLITYIAQKGADIPVKHYKILSDGEKIDISKKSKYLQLLKKPNFLNNGREFKINCFSSFFVHGFIPINIIIPIGLQIPSEIFLLPASQFYPIPEKCSNMYGMPESGVDFRSNKIIKYRLFIDNRNLDFMPEEILMINDSNLSFANGEYLTGQSRLKSALRSIKTLSNIYDTVNTLIEGKGAEGFLVKRSRPGEADPGWDEEDKKHVLKQLYSYGTTNGKNPIGVTTKDLGFVRLSVPIGDFMPIELKEHEFRVLATALLFPSVLLNDKEGSIYNNVALAQKAFYTDCLMPIVNMFYEGLNNATGLTQLNEALIPDYSEVECLQADKKLQGEIESTNDVLWKGRYESNLITLNEYLGALNLPTLPTGDKYARDNKDIPLAVRIGAGGVQSLQTILSDMNLSVNQKINILSVVFGLSQEESSLLAVNNSGDGK